jgi:hypothetical protein
VPPLFSHWWRSAIAADIDGGRNDRPVRHFLSGEDDHLRAGLGNFGRRRLGSLAVATSGPDKSG